MATRHNADRVEWREPVWECNDHASCCCCCQPQLTKRPSDTVLESVAAELQNRRTPSVNELQCLYTHGSVMS
nr:hypothetical protein BaRGS_022377 [Batillaria attramentaria]